MMAGVKKAASILRALCRAKISLMAALSAAVGTVLHAKHLTMDSLTVAGSVFLLACGMSALNQLQERDVDARMPRTRNRPIPTGTLTPFSAACVSVLLILGGLCPLALSANPGAGLLGIFAVLSYNGLYTYLKRRTAFAVIPGALVGSLGPAIGWASHGGNLWSPPIVTLCLFFYLWQIPHFWLLMIKYGTEYEQAGLPSVSRMLTPVQMRRIAAIWISSTIVASFVVVMVFLPRHVPVGFALPLLSIWVFSQVPALIRRTSPDRPRLFQRLNAYMTAVLLLIILGGI